MDKSAVGNSHTIFPCLNNTSVRLFWENDGAFFFSMKLYSVSVKYFERLMSVGTVELVTRRSQESVERPVFNILKKVTVLCTVA